jgi:hypothetical protein
MQGGSEHRNYLQKRQVWLFFTYYIMHFLKIRIRSALTNGSGTPYNEDISVVDSTDYEHDKEHE